MGCKVIVAWHLIRPWRHAYACCAVLLYAAALRFSCLESRPGACQQRRNAWAEWNGTALTLDQTDTAPKGAADCTLCRNADLGVRGVNSSRQRRWRREKIKRLDQRCRMR
ncbi:hypothetical protein LZ30DRAFT_45192 [Colletotrichum cereale]|nr:hypothetical protein LZ30DRAFT_45192 [Colletotrichum cereale]